MLELLGLLGVLVLVLVLLMVVPIASFRLGEWIGDRFRRD